MKYFFAFTSALFVLLCMGFKKIDVADCKMLSGGGTFEYGDPKNPVKVVIKGDTHIEYHEKGKYIIRSKITWVDECEYNMEMTEITIPDFPYKVGDIMNVKINRVVGKKIYYTSTVKGESWQGMFLKIK